MEKSMRVAMVNTSDQIGGAARAVFRLHQGVRGLGVESHMFVQEVTCDDHTIIGPQGKMALGFSYLRPTLDMLPLYISRNMSSSFSTAWVPSTITRKLSSKKYDIVHLHWINKGFLPVESLRDLEKPFLWTLHDMWPFTGGCHHDFGCEGYINRCGVCPQLKSKCESDLSRIIWNRKSHHWRNVKFIVVSPSQWLANCARKSSLFSQRRIEVIANGINLERFCPVDRSIARQLMGLPQHKVLLLFSAIRGPKNPFKGYKHLEEICANLEILGWKDQIELIIMGSSRPLNEPRYPFPVHYLGQLSDDITISLVYGAVDLFLAPSIQDNLPNTIIESLACGTPAVAFKVGGIPNQIDHKLNGYLAQPFDLIDFSEGIDWVLKDRERLNQLSINARKKAEKAYDIKVQAQLYLDLYNEILSR
jgi:glycosyltransferase involved in cell wall biosynthesis